MLQNDPELFELSMSEKTQPLMDLVKKHCEENIKPIQQEYSALQNEKEDRWSWHPRQIELMEGAKEKARELGLWNFFLPDPDGNIGDGLTNLDYTYVASEIGKYPLASESMNCSAPDTGNMEVLERVGTEEQKKQWLEPLLNGEIRSAYAMTEPNLASSDAKNISTSAVLDGDEWVINGEKFYISGAGDPRCKIMITMVKTSPDAHPSKQQSQILVPKDTPGVEILEGMQVFGHDHAPHGHMHIKFNNVRVPKENILLGEGKGFEISQVRLGPGRIHHCMRTIGVAERALDLLCKRSLDRVAFGKPLAELGGNYDIIADCRTEIEMCRLLTYRAADRMDKLGNQIARSDIAQIKVAVPKMALAVIDKAIQIHGGGGVSQDTPLARMYAGMRTLRLADGPDEVHRRTIARIELSKHQAAKVTNIEEKARAAKA